MMDGSPASWIDTVELETGKTWRSTPWEGIPDRVPVASQTLPTLAGDGGRRFGYETEAEWALVFDKPLVRLDGDVALKRAKVAFHGLIDTKNLEVMSTREVAYWGRFSIGNNVMTPEGAKLGNGTFGDAVEILHQPEALARTFPKVRVSFDGEDGATAKYEASIGDLASDLEEARTNLFDLVAEIREVCREEGLEKLHVINFSANGETAAFVLDRKNQKAGIGLALRRRAPRSASVPDDVPRRVPVVSAVTAGIALDAIDKNRFLHEGSARIELLGRGGKRISVARVVAQ